MGLTDEQRESYQNALSLHADALKALIGLVDAMNQAKCHKGALVVQETVCALREAQVYLAGMRGALDGEAGIDIDHPLYAPDLMQKLGPGTDET